MQNPGKILKKTQRIWPLLVAAIISTTVFGSYANAATTPKVTYKTVTIDGVDIFYREAGNPEKPTIVLLHGFPTSSHMFRDLIAELADEYHLIAPDYPGYGNSAMPAVDEFDYSFDNIASLMTQLVDQAGVSNYSLYLMDYGAPIGFRMASAQPERIDSLIIQNGNAYKEGINNDFWEPIKAYWENRSAINKGLDNPWWRNVKLAYQQPEMSNEDALRFLVTADATKWQYTNGVTDLQTISPDTWGHVQPLLDRAGNSDIQLQMFYNYGTNPPLYAAWQQYLRENQPPTLIVWGEHDEIFPKAGAEPYKRDLKHLEYHLLDTGHFALESHGQEIADMMRSFLRRNVAADALAQRQTH